MKTYNDATIEYNASNITYGGSALYTEEFTETITVADIEYGEESLEDSYSESNYSRNFVVSGDNNQEVGQSFTGNGDVLSSVKFYLRETNNPTGSCYAKIYEHSGTYGSSSVPTGVALATSDAYDISNLTTSLQLINFTFSGDDKIVLEDGTYYVVTFFYSGGGGSTIAIIGYDGTSATHSGNYSYYNNSTTEWSSGSSDLCFYVYGEPVIKFFFKSLLRTLSETITNTDSILRSIYRSISEIISNTDSLIKSTRRNISEAIIITDSKVKSIIKSVSEAITITDTKIRSLLRSISDTITNTDLISAITLFDKPASYIKKSVITPGIKKLNVTSTVAKNYASSNIVALKNKSKILKDNIISKFK